jgi:hypothetical protein
MDHPLFPGTVLSQPAASPPPSPAARAKPRVTHNVQILTGQKWLAPVSAMHERVRAEMPEACRHYLLPRPAAYYQKLLAGENGLLFGAFADEELVGSMALVWSGSFAKARSEGRLTCPDPQSRLKKKYAKGRVGIIQALGLSKDCLGRKLSCALLRAAVEAAEQQGCAHLFAQVAGDNALCWLRFMERDYAIVATWIDGHRRFLLRRQTPDEKARLLQGADLAHRQTYDKDYAALPALLAEITARAAQGDTVLLDDNPAEPGALNVVFIER